MRPPRKAAKIGNYTFDDLEKTKKEEKTLLSKIRNLKVKKSKERRDRNTEFSQPVGKKIKMEIFFSKGYCKWKRNMKREKKTNHVGKEKTQIT